MSGKIETEGTKINHLGRFQGVRSVTAGDHFVTAGTLPAL